LDDDVPTAEDLAAIPLFAGLGEPARAGLAPLFEVQEYGPGRPLVTEGESGYTFYVVVEGRAVTTQGDQHLGYLDAGDFFGEIAILGDEGRRTATVTAVTPVVAWLMFGASFRTLQQNEPTIAAALQEAMSRRLGAS
jgi:CRP-like cAMP-binding protein